MASLTKTGISDGSTLTAVMITDLYDAFIGSKSYDNIAINNSSLRVTHNGKISIGTTSTTYAVNVSGTVSASAFIGGSITLTAGGTLSLGSASTGSFGRLLQDSWEGGEVVGSERVASPSYFNQNQTSAIELDDDDNFQFIDSSFTASVEDVKSALRLIFERNHVVAEGAGACALAVALSGQIDAEHIVCIVSGGNIDVDVLSVILEG